MNAEKATHHHRQTADLLAALPSPEGINSISPTTLTTQHARHARLSFCWPMKFYQTSNQTGKERIGPPFQCRDVAKNSERTSACAHCARGGIPSRSGVAHWRQPFGRTTSWAKSIHHLPPLSCQLTQRQQPTQWTSSGPLSTCPRITKSVPQRSSQPQNSGPLVPHEGYREIQRFAHKPPDAQPIRSAFPSQGGGRSGVRPAGCR